jgi:hypothetical protein
LKTTDPTCIKIELEQGDLRGSTVTVSAGGLQISVVGESEGCLKIFPVPVRGSLVVNDVLRILSSTDTTLYVLVNSDSKGSRPQLIAVNTWC